MSDLRAQGYRDFQETLDEIDALGLTREVFGESSEGRPLVAARLGRGERRVLLVGNIHGVEHISSRVVLGFLRALVRKEIEIDAEVICVPILNPDGFERTFEQGGHGSLKALRTNAKGVDLNRNFPPPTGTAYTKWPFGGTNNQSKATYRGPHPASETEVRALMDLGRSVHAVVSCHSFMGSLVTPRLADKAAFQAYDALCEAFRGPQKHRYFRLASRFVDGFTGELEDYFHHDRDAWSVCVETFPIAKSYAAHPIARRVFWRFNPKDPAYWVAHDVPAIAAFFRAALERERPSTFRETS